MPLPKYDPLEALYVLALITGMRQGELLALKWSDLDLTYGKLQVQRTLIRVSGGKAVVNEPKSPTARRCIHLPQLAIEALIRHAQTQHVTQPNAKRASAWVFCDENGVPLQAASMLRHSFQPLLTKAGLPQIRFHDVRHSTATLLLTLGVHPKIVQELLGHSQIFVTLDIYSHILPTLQKEAMHQFNDALAHPSDERVRGEKGVISRARSDMR